MRFRLRDIPAMLQTGAGRLHVRQGIAYRLWPVLSLAAYVYRRTIVRRTRVIVVVGSFGKSTTTRAATAALNTPVHPWLLFNAWAWIAFAVLRIRRAQARAVIEVGISRPGCMKGYARTVHPDVVVVTTIGSEHHRSLGTIEVTRAEKSLMVGALPPDGVAVLNGDDANVMWMRSVTQERVVTFGFGGACDVRADAYTLDWPNGSRFRVTAFGEQREVSIRLLGQHMVYPILAAIAVACVEGINLDLALQRLAALPPTTARLEPVPLPGGVTVLRDDYKSTLETVHSALDVLEGIPDARRVVLLGDVSEPPGSQRAIYQAIGARVAAMASHLVFVGHGGPRYRSGATRAGMDRSAVIDGGRTPSSAAQVLRGILRPGDVLLIKGRGPEKLDRVRLILDGRNVACDIRTCSIRTLECEECPMLERGWEGKRVIM